MLSTVKHHENNLLTNHLMGGLCFMMLPATYKLIDTLTA